ncbi:MAG: outer membrane beta-barrel protein [Bacteroidales bacterium]|jgi:opacity protein-like surface antigen|nr:outer membrane beta-barrel protein [Bacteroidales bacterium]
MKKRIIFVVWLIPLLCSGQGTWYGEYSVFGGGGTNDIYRFRELDGAGSVTGTGMWNGGIDLRRLIGDHFSIETGISYAHQYYYTSPAPGIEGEDSPGSLGMITIPVTARLDFLKWFFADAGALFGIQAGIPNFENMSGLGATVGAGFQYMFKSDVFVRVRAYGSQYGLLHFFPDDYPRTLFNSGITVGIGYRFIHLGSCNCPADNSPRRRFY